MFDELKELKCGSIIECWDRTSGQEATKLRNMRDEPGEMNRAWIMKGIVNHGVQAMLKPMKEPLQRFEFFIFLVAIWRPDQKKRKIGGSETS